MKIMKWTVIVGCLALTTATIGAQGDQARGTAAPAAGSAAAAIRQIADAYVKATTSGDAKAVAALYTEDAVEMPPNLPMVKGRAAIQQYYEKVFSTGFKPATFNLKHLDTHATGDAGFDVGTYEQTMAQPSAGSPSTETGKYAVILKRTAAGWKVAYAIYNSDQAPKPGGGGR
ncbi:MAG TPA: SgcJ/EcaC family oxidoreductase [Vicinamibacterales bacterium]|jgi:uncharacterized protein (TIGR02246 family)